MSKIIPEITEKFEVVLASSSARRYEIVHDIMGFSETTIMKPSFEEDLDKTLYEGRPVDYVIDTSRGKADSILDDLKDDKKVNLRPKIVICADTIVIDENDTIHEKPKIEEVQLRNLEAFCKSKDPVRVATAVNIILWRGPDQYEISSFHDITELYFDHDLPSDIVRDFVRSHNSLEVAGGFQVQTFGGCMIPRINGDYYNVVGLPLNKTFKTIYTFAKRT